ncbi:xanthine dehydrogenase family protein molybdopterin-binding subunit [Rubrimonas cliftonensis]|uniref:Xanthine dehydrogenase, molybdenum binding subunit apoprotein n=1 Tax=Rubrimonas cliftonensis TaxID=89524 RepID=A0A1H3VKW4_9RHOB|nr:xanthine dehydrogenase family protein molybdopterin-binding subunit [Rubrimonas cliftonensis]SDZ74788.1 xanthine dehydrogenase, molybdenum binding subunit apoprotein [Rubrimonas cliftonensis]
MNKQMTGIGASSKRREDVRFLTGKGQYTDDINRHGQLYAHFVRSEVAHGKITKLDASAAAAAPGVAHVFTSKDFEGVGGVPCGWLITDKNGEPMKEPKHPILAEGKVRHVGDPIAVVVAETLAQARDAAELIDLEIEELPAVIDMREALKGGVAVHDEAPDNLCYDWEFVAENKAAVDEAIARAAHVTTLELVNNRLVANPMEPRCAIGEYDRAGDQHTLYTTSQNPHVIRLLMGAFVLGIPEHKLRVVAPDVGGGFGTKIYHYAEEAFVTFAAKKLNKPVKWTASRSEAFMSDAQGRDHVTKVELALDADNNFTALRCLTHANMGAYLSTFAPCIPTWLHGTLLAGNYRTPLIFTNVKAVFTNTVPVDAYRGAGRPEATYQLERVIDKAARELGVSPIALRKQNFIKPDQFPYQTPVAVVYDTGDYDATMDKVVEMADLAGFDARKAEAKSRGKLRGLGFAHYIEACGIAPSSLVGALGARAGLYEAATVRVNPTGSVSVFTGSHSHGQGHETTFAQVVSDMLGIPEDQIDIVHGDTNRVPFGMGTYGSRSLAVGGSAIVKSVEKIVSKARKIAAHLLEASEADITFEDGQFKVAGTDRAKAFGEIALAAYVPHQYPIEEIEPGLEETSFYDPKNFTYPSGGYACEVEVDPETGVVKVCAFHAADDFGNLVNPMIVEGQIHGGVAQGIGQAMLEHCTFDADGQPQAGSYMDYAMPRAADMPMVNIDSSCVTPCTHNPLGVKGCGEAGAIGSPPAFVNAVIDALAERGVTHIDMPLTPQAVWKAIHGASAVAAE